MSDKIKKKRLENNPEIQKKLEEEQDIDKKDFVGLLRKAVRPVKPSSRQSA